MAGVVGAIAVLKANFVVGLKKGGEWEILVLLTSPSFVFWKVIDGEIYHKNIKRVMHERRKILS